jgi:hypothetical protein
MCARAIYWAGNGRVVYGQTEKSLKEQTGAHEENPTLYLPISKDLAGLLKPRWLRIGGYWFPRGGMPIAGKAVSHQRECGSRITALLPIAAAAD